jgi:hypothetical protein
MTNPNRIENTLVMDNNYDLISVSGPQGERKLKMMSINKMGATAGSFEISEKDLRVK